MATGFLLAVEYIFKHFGTVAIPSTTITLKADFLSRNFLLLLIYKFSRENSELEWYKGSEVRQM